MIDGFEYSTIGVGESTYRVGLAGDGQGAIEPEAADRYAADFTPEAISAWCSDYRAAFHSDRHLDARDREAGVRRFL